MSLNRLSLIKMDFEYFHDRETMIQLALGSNGRGYGYTLDDINNYRDRDLYGDQNELLNYINQFEDFKSQVDMGGAFTKQRLKLSSDERGIFSFGSASTGLYKPQEFYSFLLAQELPNEFPDYPSGIVPPLFVSKESLLKFNNEETPSFFYTSQTNGKTYQLIKQDEGTLEIELGLRQNKVYRTTQKKCYMILPKKGGKAKMVDLYIPKNHGIKLPQIMPTLMLADYLRQYGVMTRISVMRVFDNYYGGNSIVGYAFKVKDFGDDLDFNRLALEGADYKTWRLVKNCVGNLQSGRRQGLINYGNPNATGGSKYEGNYPEGMLMTEFMGRFRNFYMQKMDRGEIEGTRLDKRLMLMGITKKDKTSMDDITEKFYELLDVVDTQFNKIEEACKRIYIREVEESKRLTKSEFKDYMVGVFNLAYSYPIEGDYEETEESKKEIDAEFEEKLDGLDSFLQSI